MSTLITRFFIYLLIIFSLFPYIQILPLGTDSQPNALFIATLLFPFCCKWKMNKYLVFILLIAIFSTFALILSPITLRGIKSVLNYFTLFFVSYVTFYALKKIKGIPFSLFKNCVYCWFIVGTIQLLIYPSFLSFLIPRGNSEALIKSGRGIVCLAPEPTFYALMCLFFALIAYLNFRNEKGIKTIYYLIFIQLFIYSRSSLVIFIIFGILGVYFLLKILTKKTYIFKAIGIIALLSIIITPIYLHYADVLNKFRIGKLLNILIEKPELFIVLDGSVNERFVHVFFPIYGFITNFGLPHGYGVFPEFLNGCMKEPSFQHLFSDYVLNRPVDPYIMSGWGSILFELGAIGLLLIYTIYKLTSKILNGKARIIVLLLIYSILANAIPFSNAIIPFFIGNLFYLNYKKSKQHQAVSKQYESPSN